MPLAWNTYFPWNGGFDFTVLRHDQDFTLQENYLEVILRGINNSIRNAVAFSNENNLADAVFVPNAQPAST
jgi:hypothetical protein